MNAKGIITFEKNDTSWPGDRPKPEENQSGQKGGETGDEVKKEEQAEEKKEGEGEKFSGDEDAKFLEKLVEKLKGDDKKSPEEKIDELIQKSHHILMQVSSYSMFGFFSSTLTIDANKISIIIREFLGTDQIYSIPIKELQDVEVDISLFNTSLKIIDKRYKDKPIVLKGLNREKAIEARRIIQGLVISVDQKIDVGKMDPGEAVEKVAELGSDQEVRKV